MIPYEFDAERFSRWMSYVLRHNPTRYGLQPDRHGYVDAEEFFRIATRRYPGVTPERLRELIAEGGDGRFEMIGTQLRARYGHSIPVEPPGLPIEPPVYLYYGTEVSRAESALTAGLSPLDRRMLHLSETAADAWAVAKRKTDQPAVLRILAPQAHAAGAVFYHEGKVYLSPQISAQFLQTESLPSTAVS